MDKHTQIKYVQKERQKTDKHWCDCHIGALKEEECRGSTNEEKCDRGQQERRLTEGRMWSERKWNNKKRSAQNMKAGR